MQMAKLISSWSKDPEKQVGCVIVDKNKRIISTGYNGYPSGFNDQDTADRLSKVVHAEMNAIISARSDLTGCTLYVYPLLPCSSCAGAIVQAGITRVVVFDILDLPKWRTDISKDIFDELGIKLEVIYV